MKIQMEIGAIANCIEFCEIFSAHGIQICKCERSLLSHADLTNRAFLLVERRETQSAGVT